MEKISDLESSPDSNADFSAKEEQLTTIYRFKRELFFKVALRHSGGVRADAEDLINETFLRAWDLLSSYKLGMSMKSWLYAIMRKCSINRFNERKRDTHPVTALIDMAESETVNTIPSDGLMGSEMQRALAKLSLEYREAFLLFELEDYTYQEIKEVQNVKPGTVMSRIHRARKQLRAALRVYYESNYRRGLPLDQVRGDQTERALPEYRKAA